MTLETITHSDMSYLNILNIGKIDMVQHSQLFKQCLFSMKCTLTSFVWIPAIWLYVSVRYLCLGTSMGTNLSNVAAFSLGNVLWRKLPKNSLGNKQWRKLPNNSLGDELGRKLPNNSFGDVLWRKLPSKSL